MQEQIRQSREIFQTAVEEWEARGFDQHAAFRNFAVGEVLSEYEVIDDNTIENITRIDRSGDRGIDAWHITTSEESDEPHVLHLIQSKDTDVTESDIDKLFNNFRQLFPAIPSNPPYQRANELVKDLCRELQDMYLAKPGENNLLIQFYLVTSTIAPESTRQKIGELPKSVELDGKSYKCNAYIWDAADLADGYQIDHSAKDITFQTQVPTMELLEKNDKFKSITIALPGNVLAQIFEKHKVTLFRNNPRYYQGKRTAINRRIFNTLETSDGRRNFYIYNNGITATCDSIRTEHVKDLFSPSTPAQTKITCMNFQIVNGCQTTATLYEAYKAGYDVAEASVQLRIIESQNMAPEISKYTNLQNKMKEEDFKSDDPLQDRLVREFGELTYDGGPWFYEVQRGRWAYDYPKQSDRKIYSSDRYGWRKFQMSELAQPCISFLGRPEIGTDRPGSIYTNPNIYDQVFPKTITAWQALLPYIIYRESKKLVDSDSANDSIRKYVTLNHTHFISRLLWVLKMGGKSDTRTELRYFPREESRKLLDTMADWFDAIQGITLPSLRRTIETESTKEGISERQFVRRNDWQTEAFETVKSLALTTLRTEWQIAQRENIDPATIGLRQHLALFQIQEI